MFADFIILHLFYCHRKLKHLTIYPYYPSCSAKVTQSSLKQMFPVTYGELVADVLLPEFWDVMSQKHESCLFFTPWTVVELLQRVFRMFNSLHLYTVSVICDTSLCCHLISLCCHGDGVLASTFDLTFSWGCLLQLQLVVVCLCVFVGVWVWQSGNECNTSHLGTGQLWQTCLYPCAYRGKGGDGAFDGHRGFSACVRNWCQIESSDLSDNTVITRLILKTDSRSVSRQTITVTELHEEGHMAVGLLFWVVESNISKLLIFATW